MRTIYIVLLAVSATVLVGTSALFVTSAATGKPIFSGQGQPSYNNVGMMGDGRGMMGNFHNGISMGQMMGPFASGTTTSYAGRMMGASYSNLNSWCFQYMSRFFGQVWNATK